MTRQAELAERLWKHVGCKPARQVWGSLRISQGRVSVGRGGGPEGRSRMGSE